ncbi:MAG: IclR family transcriptional regulator [Anaerovorax sp.]
MKTLENSNHVKSILKAFLIIEALDKEVEMSIGEISETLDMDKGTVHRLVNTIKDAGYITQNPDNRKYANSLKLFAMGSRVVEKTGVKQIARPFVEQLAKETKETVNLGLRIGGNIIYIDKIESNSTIKVGIDIGVSIPDYCTGMGKAVIAFLTVEERDEIFKDCDFQGYAPNTVTNREDLESRLRVVREKGYSKDDEEFVGGLISFGAPIFDYHGKPVAAISVSCPKYRYEESVDKNYFSSRVVQVALEISKQLGYRPKGYKV